MSVLKVGPGNFELITIQAAPKKVFKSGTMGVTGSAPLFARKSDMIKEVQPLAPLSRSYYTADTFQDRFNQYQKASGQAVRNSTAENPGNFAGSAEALLEKVNEIKKSPSQDIESKIIRFEPSFTFTADTGRKLAITNGLMPTYLPAHPTSQFAYHNYHSMNFFTSSNVPRSAVLLYPNSASLADGNQVSGSYVVSDAFTFEFFIKPKCYLEKPTREVKAGTILHLSSTYAVSLITGSSRDGNSIPNAFRLQLQLSQSADVKPSRALSGTFPNNLVFLSDDNVLKRDHWHHVAIRWGTRADGQEGAFYVDNNSAGNFTVTASSIAPTALAHNPGVLAVGNYFDGSNSGDNRQMRFFTARNAGREGLTIMDPDSNAENPTSYQFDHPLCAELHEVRIFNRFRSNAEIVEGSKRGISRDAAGLQFYLPPMFTAHSPRRKQLGGFGGVLQTPFFGSPGSTTDPFNIALSFGVGGHYLNLENFTQDFATRNFPRAMDLSGAQITATTQAKSCNTFFYSTASIRYRNLFMPPCDNGNFMPNFDLIRQIETGSLPTVKVKTGSNYYKYRNDLGDVDLSLINLRDQLPSSSFVNYIVDYSPFNKDGDAEVNRDPNGAIVSDHIVHVGSGFENQIMGPGPGDMGIDPGEVLTIFQRTRDDSSNEVVMFDISNLFYGMRIKPGTFKITDTNQTGSFGKQAMTLRDDSYGNLYRADAKTKHATWNSVGNIFYNEGIVIIKSPNIPLFGKTDVEVEFRGENEVHVSKLDIVAPAAMINSSSNVNYTEASSSLDANDQNSQFVAITGLNFHDDNLNVIMRTKFAQPVIKRSSDKILFRTKLDF
jgi:hypothetical protein